MGGGVVWCMYMCTGGGNYEILALIRMQGGIVDVLIAEKFLQFEEIHKTPMELMRFAVFIAIAYVWPLY